VRTSGIALVAAGILLAGFVPDRAFAWCRTASCPMGQVGARCMPPTMDDCGIELFWPTQCVGFSIQKDGAPGLPATKVDSIAKLAFAAWMNVDCGGGEHPAIHVSDLGEVTCNQVEYNPKGANSNTIMFRSNGWPYTKTNALALTTVTYNLDTGEIRDADMELNSTDVKFSTSDTTVTYDLQSIMTHEAGHFLGLAHSQLENATMRPDYPMGSTTLRTPQVDDVEAICNAYPPTLPTACDPTPRGGLGDACNSPAVTTPTPTSGCCAVAVGASPEGSEAALAFGALGLAFGARSLRKRRRRSEAQRAHPPRRGANDPNPRRGSRS